MIESEPVKATFETSYYRKLKYLSTGVSSGVVLDPATYKCRNDYRIDINLGDKVASPGESRKKFRAAQLTQATLR